MSNTKTVMGQASNQYVVPLDITDVFSTYLYTGTGSAQTITNGIDLDGEGGLVWTKSRSAARNHSLHDSARGVTCLLKSNATNAQYCDATQMASFNSNGFTVGSDGSSNTNGDDYASWTFRKAPKFFDVVTYTGDGVACRTVSHNLGTTVGSIFVKRTDASWGWQVYHRGLSNPATKMLQLHNAEPEITGFWYSTAATSTEFTVNDSNSINQSGGTYVAYLFAHNDGDGGFGPDGSDIIKCGSYTGNGSTNGPEIDLGFEPQWLLIKNTGTTSQWRMMDNMRGLPVGGTDISLEANESNSETTDTNTANVDIKPNGFKITTGRGDWNNNGNTIIYMAIRRGPLAPPESGTEVFDVDSYSSNGNSNIFNTGFDADMNIISLTTGSIKFLQSRLNSGKYLRTNDTNAESNSVASVWNTASNVVNLKDGWYGLTPTTISWSWKRAPGYFDVVAYTGNSTSGRTVSHNLGVAPEMMWVKRRESTGVWGTYHSGVDATSPEDFYLKVESSDARVNDARFWNDTAPDDTVFTLGTHSQVNFSGGTYIAYLFASLPGISKVGSFVIDNSGGTLDVNCGFASGARFVLFKRSSGVGAWYVFDSERGITVNADPYLTLNSTNAEDTWTVMTPLSSGFTIANNGSTGSGTYIFYAIA